MRNRTTVNEVRNSRMRVAVFKNHTSHISSNENEI